MQGLRREVHAELAPEVEARAARASARELLEKDEEIRERERQIAALKHQVMSLSKKLPRPHAQALGLVREETLAQRLASRCPNDQIVPISKAARGADILQRVAAPSGRACGTILWESKRTASWGKTWVPKLREDQRRGNHTVAVIVSDVLPEVGRSLTQVDGVWVATLDVAPDLAVMLREKLIDVASARGARARRDDLKGLAYDYLTGEAFVAHVRVIIEAAHKMRGGLEQERRTLQTRWAERERQIESVVEGLAGVYGDLRGLGAALPIVEQLELPVPEPL